MNPNKPEGSSGSSKRVANSLVALGSSAVMVVYAAGYLRTRAAAQRFTDDAAPRRAAAPVEVITPAVATPPKKKVARAEPRPRTLPPVATAIPADPVVTPPVVAPPIVEPPPPPPVKPASLYKDGAYSGWGTSRHGDIQATVVIEGGRIVSASISQCLTRYSCSWIAALPPQIVTRQSAECDFVSGATQSTNAFYYAVLEALAKAK